MDPASEPQQQSTIHDVQRRVGRNLLLFQQIEMLLNATEVRRLKVRSIASRLSTISAAWLTWASSAISRAAASDVQSAGFTVVPGGRHGNGNTDNALIGFADGAYIELIAPTDQGRTAEHRWFLRLRNGGGLVDFCLLSTDLAGEIAATRARGVEYSQPFAMARETPDGTRIAWSSLGTPPGAVGEKGWPFMIEDTNPRALRVPHAPEQIGHRNGATGVAGITVLVRDVAESAQEYAAILGTRAPTLRSPPDDQGQGSILAFGAMWILLSEPDSQDAIERIERHGQGPCRSTLRRHEGPISPGAGSLLDPALFSGAKIALA